MSCCKPQTSSYADSEIIELLESETGYGNSMAADKPSIMIASIYQNERKSGHQGDWIIRKLERRIHSILDSNKWMMGRMRNLKHPSKRLAVVVEEKFCDPKDYILREVDDEIFEGIGRDDNEIDMLAATVKYQMKRPQSADSNRNSSPVPNSQNQRSQSVESPRHQEKPPKDQEKPPKDQGKPPKGKLGIIKPIKKVKNSKINPSPENKESENPIQKAETTPLPDAEPTAQFNYNTLCSKLMSPKYHLGSAKQLWDKDSGKYFQAGIIQNSTRTKFCLYLSANHMMFDGATLYQIWKQLDFSEEISKINAQRKHNFEENLQKSMSIIPKGVDFKKYQSQCMKDWFKACVKKGVAQKWRKLKMKEYLIEFDLEEIQKIKDSHHEIQCMSCGKNANWVSTNDIITSWIREIIPKADNIMLAINCRNRVEGIEDNDAGNYLTCPFLTKHDLETPLNVRAWMNKVTRSGNNYPKLNYSDFKHFMGGVHTNWSRFYHDVTVDGFKQLIHFPVIKMESQVGPIPVGIEINLVTFYCGIGKLAGYVVSKRKDMCLEKLLDSKIVKGVIKIE